MPIETVKIHKEFEGQEHDMLQSFIEMHIIHVTLNINKTLINETECDLLPSLNKGFSK